ncbi:MAG TPA: DUF3667 domain-containing protein [Thermoanaerobaculia bacterium]|jgi:hypothetical protein
MTQPAPHLPPQETSACTNCGHGTVEVYCARCGEKQPDHHDRTVGHFAHELFHELAHVDSKVFRTLRDLVARPGELTAAYFEGRKQRYIAPLRLFLTLFAIQFLAYSAYKPVAVYSLETMMHADKSHQFETMLKRTAVKHKVPFEQLVERIEHRWQKNMSLLSLLNIAGVAFALKALYARRKRYLAEHLIFAAHFMCFVYVMSIASWPLHLLTGVQRNAANTVITILTSAVAIFYLFIGLRRVYGQGPVRRFFKSALLWGATFATSLVLMTASLLAALLQVLRA